MAKEAELVHNGLVNVPQIDIEYRDFHIVPKLDFGSTPYQNVNTYRKGYVIVKDGVNVMPGATWATSVIEAKVMIDVYIEADGNGEMFWKILRVKQGMCDYEKV